MRPSLAEKFRLFQLIDIFGAWFYVPVVPLSLVLARRSRATAVAGLLACGVLFAAEYGRLFVPRSSTARGRRMRVMTSNLMWHNADPAVFAATVARERPDVVAVQELTWTMAGRLAEALRVSHPYPTLAPT